MSDILYTACSVTCVSMVSTYYKFDVCRPGSKEIFTLNI